MEKLDTILKDKRKYLLCWGVLVLVTILRLTNTLSEQLFADVVDVVLWAFILGNSMEHGAKALKSRQRKANE